MTRPIDIRDIVPRDAVLGDKRLGLDADENLAMTNQPDNSIIGTAASRNIGTAEDQIPLNSDLPASAKSGDYNDLDNLPTLGTAASKNTGTATGEIPTADDLDMVGASINWTDLNYQSTDYNGIGHSLVARNDSGGSISAGATVDGALLTTARWDAALNLSALGVLSGGDWINMGAFCPASGYSTFTKRT